MTETSAICIQSNIKKKKNARTLSTSAGVSVLLKTAQGFFFIQTSCTAAADASQELFHDEATQHLCLERWLTASPDLF